MKTLHLLIVITIISFCIVSIIPSYSECMGTFQPNIQKDNGMDIEGYHTYLASTNDNQTYPIKYKISSGAVIEAISSETQSPVLNIIVREVPQGGNLTIQLPTKVLGLYSAGGYSVAEGAMCAAIIGTSFPTPIESNLNFTTVKFPLMSYSGVDEMIYITGNIQQPSTISEFPSPLKQFKSGILANNVTCNQGLDLIFKTEDGSPDCVKPDTANILVKRGWALETNTINSIHVQNSNFTVSYNISGGKLDLVEYNKTRSSLVILLTTSGNGDLSITIPRALLDSRQHIQPYQFLVLVNENPIRYAQTTTIYDNTLTIPFNNGSTKIEIAND